MKSENDIEDIMHAHGNTDGEVVLKASLDGVDYPIVIGSKLEGIADRIASFTHSKRIFILSDSFFKGGYCSQLENDL